MRCATVLALASATGAVAQLWEQNYTSSLDMEIDSNTVDPGEKTTWCNAQYNTCRTLCGDDTESNDCDLQTLEIDCKCTSNSSAPGLQYYSQTVPFFICKELDKRCRESTDVAKEQDQCTENIGDLCFEQAPPAKSNTDDDEGDDEEDQDDNEQTSTTQDSGPTETGENEQTTETGDNDDSAALKVSPLLNSGIALAAMGLFAYVL